MLPFDKEYVKYNIAKINIETKAIVRLIFFRDSDSNDIILAPFKTITLLMPIFLFNIIIQKRQKKNKTFVKKSCFSKNQRLFLLFYYHLN